METVLTTVYVNLSFLKRNEVAYYNGVNVMLADIDPILQCVFPADFLVYKGAYFVHGSNN